MRSWVVCLGLGLSIGCGAKSGLLDGYEGAGGLSDGGAGSSGRGGSGGIVGTGGFGATGGVGTGGFAGTGGSAGSGGTGGFPRCRAFVEQEARTFLGVSSHHENFPQLVQTDSGMVTMAFRWDPFEGPIVWTKLGHVSFDAWGPWTTDPLGQAWLGADRAGESFALGPDELGGFAFLVSTSNPASPEIGTYLGRGHPDEKNAVTELIISDPVDVLDVANDGWTLLLAYGREFEGHHALTIRVNHGAFSSIFGDLGCATQPLQTDAIPFLDGFLVAVSTSRDFRTCHDDSGFDGPPDRIQLAYLRPTGALGVDLITEIPVGESVARMRLVPRGTNQAWLTFQGTGGGVTPPPIYAVRLNDEGNLYSLWNRVVEGGYQLEPAAVDNLGEYLALAVIDAFDPSTPQILVRLHDEESTTPVLSHVISPPPDQWPMGPLALLGSPDGTSLLVAWSGSNMSAGEPNRIYTKRLDCLP